MNVWAEVPGAFTFIEDGTSYVETGWVTTAASTGTIGVTAYALDAVFGRGNI
jgi:hypothetical protein